ncbi:hypothetical protein BSPWISOX_2008 [uncultured Gammaproteobacteria bacterium]|nr:hypothetical protein BSPWISOX_2008 [uncultured Gammaproteobacteria bacterium]
MSPAHHNLNNQQLKPLSNLTFQSCILPAHHNLNNQQLKHISKEISLCIQRPAHHNLKQPATETLLPL